MDFVIALYVALFILNVLVVIFLLLSTNLLLKVIEIPTRFLGVLILTLSFVGVYSLRNSPIDCAIAGGFGVFGYILKRLSLPVVPIVLGMVLGGIMENKLRTSMMRVDTPLDFISRPIAFVLFLMIVAVLLVQLRGRGGLNYPQGVTARPCHTTLADLPGARFPKFLDTAVVLLTAATPTGSQAFHKLTTGCVCFYARIFVPFTRLKTYPANQYMICYIITKLTC